ncbi:MAG: CRISPR-associated helicase Cas3' [Terriglobia bacterium]
MLYEKCWAKTTENGSPGISVRDHCLNVGCVAEALLTLLPPQLHSLIPPSTATLAALHDIGKVSPGFQVKSEAWLVQRALRDQALKEGWNVRVSDHAKISQFTVQSVLRSSHLHRWAVVVGAHHGRIKGERVEVGEPWEEQRRRLAEDLIREFGPLPDQPPADATIWVVAGLITIADWIGSDERHFSQDARWDMPQRRRQAQTALATINWRSVEIRQLNGFGDLFPEIPPPNSLQTATVQVARDPGVYVIEGPMGCGKTEAALAAAYQLMAARKATGLYFALPTQVTSNRIHLRVLPFVERISVHPAEVRLAHSASWLAETKAPAALRPASLNDAEAQEHVHAGRSWFASAKQALLAPFGVGTIDQALLGIVAAKHFFVRQFGLAGKVVILDEVHTYDLYTSTLIDALVKRLRELQSTVIILSATLTEKRRRELLGLADHQPAIAAYPLVSGVASSLIESACESPPAKTIQIRNVFGALPLEGAMERAMHGECLLWIRNTVDEAQETYRALQSANFEGGPSVALLHSRFPFFRREQLETDWMTRLGKDSTNRPNGCVLVSTQVAEQSVDIDADLLISDLAPTDMLLQRLGRLWRHGRAARPCPQPEVWIQMPHLDDASLRAASEKEIRQALGKSARVYAPYILLRSLYQWRGRATITLPADIRPILEATYADPNAAEPPAWQGLREQLEKRKEEMALLALNAITIWNNPPLPDEEGVQTRVITYPTAQLLLATEITAHDSHSSRLCLTDGAEVTAHDRDWSFVAAKAIYRNLVRVPRRAIAAGLDKPPRWLANHVAQPTAVGLVQSGGRILWPGDEQQTGLSYDANEGIIIKSKRSPRPHDEESDESYD